MIFTVDNSFAAIRRRVELFVELVRILAPVDTLDAVVEALGGVTDFFSF